MTSIRKSAAAVVLCSLLGGSAVAQDRPVYLDASAPLERRIDDALRRMTLHEKIQLLHAQSKFTSAGVPRLGIRQLNMDDGPHGVRAELKWNDWDSAAWTNDSCVAFPSLTCLAATWNPAMGALYGHVLSEEFAYRGKDMILGPGVNIYRHPFNGRNFEYMGEDPCLAGRMVVPYIEAAQRNGVACCLKHFFLNNQETDRWDGNVNVDERAVHEIYLPAFKQAVQQAHVWAVMGSYNKWNGVHCSHNDSLLNGILKRDWGFDGVVVSDWDATHDARQAATGGLDLEMGTTRGTAPKGEPFTYNHSFLGDAFERAVREGVWPESLVDEKARRVLRTIFRTAMNPAKTIGSMCSEEHYAACRTMGAQGIVLLKNDRQVLPLQAGRYRRILVVGENATRSLTQGGGSSELKTKYDVSPLEALQQEFGERVVYAQGYSSGRALYDRVDAVPAALQDSLRRAALAAAQQADLIIFVGGLNKNRQQDCEDSDRESYHLSFGQDELIAALARTGRPVVVANFGGNAYAMPWIEQVAGVLHCWYLGSEAGHALTDVLTGRVNPSGRLPMTFAKRVEDYPPMQYGREAYPGVDKQVYYREGIFVGYRHFVSRKVKALFPFGYGLSYTTFRYGRPRLDRTQLTAGGSIRLTVDVTNTGARRGEEVVQLYIGEDKPVVERPARELKDFSKVGLDPGETRTLTFEIRPEMLQYYSSDLHRWTSTPGSFHAYVSASSEDVRGAVAFELK